MDTLALHSQDGAGADLEALLQQAGAIAVPLLGGPSSPG